MSWGGGRGRWYMRWHDDGLCGFVKGTLRVRKCCCRWGWLTCLIVSCGDSFAGSIMVVVVVVVDILARGFDVTSRGPDSQ
jgi:hypothetical protein